MYWEVGIKIGDEAGQVTVHPQALAGPCGTTQWNTLWRWRLRCIRTAY